jgi:hypothetical protein
MKDRIVYYDFADLFYSSYYLLGFMANKENFNYDFSITKDIPPLLRSSAFDDTWRKILFSICLFKATVGGEEFYFCIDTRDSAKPDALNGLGYHLPLLDTVKYYFKANYDRVVVEEDPRLRPHARKIIPVDIFFPLKVPGMLRLLPRLTNCPEVGWSRRNVLNRVKELISPVNLSHVRNLRNAPKDLDFFFVMTYYSDDIHQKHNEFRYQLITEIRKLPGISAEAGFASRRPLPGKFGSVQVRRYDLNEYLEVLAKSRVGIYVRGMYDCLSFKLGQFLALGLPVIGQTLQNNRENLYQNPYFKDQFRFDEVHDIVQNAVEALRQPELLTAWSRSNASTYDSTFTPEAVTAKMLSRMIDRT